MFLAHASLRRLFLLTGLCAAALGGGPLAAQVLLIHAVPSTSYAVDVQTKLTASGLIQGSIDLFDAKTTAAPTLAQLQQYKAVMVFSDSTFTNPTALGDVLADYVDAGGGVVQAVFTTFTGWPLAGRWESQDYDPLVLGSYGGSSLTLGTVSQPGSPIMTGITNLNSGSSNYVSGTATLRSGGVLVASWSDGSPLVVLNSNFNNRVLVLNMYPPSSDALGGAWLSSTDGTRLMANSLNFVAIPEPSTWALLALGGGLLLVAARRRAA